VSLLGCTSGVNTACWLCGGLGAAYSFFDLELAPELESILLDSAVMAAARALAFFGLLWTVVHKMTGTSAEHAEVVVQTPFSLVHG